MGRIAGFLRTWVVGRLLKRNPIVFGLLWVADRLRRSRRIAREVPLSTLRARGRVGADFLDRRGLVDRDATPPSGELDDLDAFARPAPGEDRDGNPDGDPDGDGTVDGDRASAADSAFDPAAVDPEVRRFCERTAEYAFVYRVRWGRGFRVGARLASRLTSRIEQLNLPGAGTGWRRLHSRFVPVDLPDDPREDVRGWVRTDGDGDCVFLALYGTHVADGGGDATGGDPGERFANVAVPLPGCTLSTVLRARNLDGGGLLGGRIGGSGRPDGGIEWTTGGPGQPGLYLRFPGLPVGLPVSQRFRVWPAEAGESGDLRATHEMWLFGLKFLRVAYRMER